MWAGAWGLFASELSALVACRLFTLACVFTATVFSGGQLGSWGLAAVKAMQPGQLAGIGRRQPKTVGGAAEA